MKTKTFLLLRVLFAVFSPVLHAAEKNDSTKIYFSTAFDELKSMLEGKQTPSFERAVFISENPFHNNQYKYETFQKNIDFHLFFIENLAAANDYSDTMKYIPKVKANGRFDINEIAISPTRKKELYKNALNNWAIFTYMEDTTGIYPFMHLPFSYSASDPFGMKDWSNSQLINLLASEKQEGNCFALTAFFKIMADRLKTDAYICTAPQHIYIQHRDNKGQYYNVELATAGHPGDGMLQTLTYTTSTAIESGISLRSYNAQQSIGLCMVNLAKAYEHKFNTKDDDFLLQCAETVLQYDSLNLNALLLKHQVLNERMLKILSENKTTNLSKITKEITFFELEKHLARLQRLGYIQMPMDVQEMVLNGFEEVKQGKKIDRNPKPFTVEGIPEKYNQYYTLTGGLFQEVFEPKKFEEYGQFTFNTETKTIDAIDTAKKNFSLIDPVAFAYDFGARIYDARLGRFLSVDPSEKSYPYFSPYMAFNGNPVYFVDPTGKDGRVSITEKAGENGSVIKVITVSTVNWLSSSVVDPTVNKMQSNTNIMVNGTYSYTENGQQYEIVMDIRFQKFTKEQEEKYEATGELPTKGDNYFTEGSDAHGSGGDWFINSYDQENDQADIGFSPGNTATASAASAYHEAPHLLGLLDRYIMPDGPGKESTKDNEEVMSSLGYKFDIAIHGKAFIDFANRKMAENPGQNEFLINKREYVMNYNIKNISKKHTFIDAINDGLVGKPEGK